MVNDMRGFFNKYVNKITADFEQRIGEIYLVLADAGRIGDTPCYRIGIFDERDRNILEMMSHKSHALITKEQGDKVIQACKDSEYAEIPRLLLYNRFGYNNKETMDNIRNWLDLQLYYVKRERRLSFTP